MQSILVINNINKRPFTLCLCVLAMTLLTSCSQSNINRSLETAENVLSEKPDSALSILCEIDYATLKQDKYKALYGLLYTAATYKEHNVLDNDSLIDYSIRIFKDYSDSYHLADAYYYKGAMNYKRKQIEVCANNLKKAERLSIENNFVLITNKVYELLIYVNYISENKSLRMEYSKKFLESSIELNDQPLIARASAMVASAYAANNMTDSAYLYIKKGLNYINSVDSVLKADILVYVGEMYYEKQQFNISEKYAIESDSIDPNPHAKMLLGKIEYQKGNTLTAESLWKEALSTNDQKLKKQLYRVLSNYYAAVGQSHEAYLLLQKLDSINNDINDNSKTIQELQLKFDRAKSESELYQKLIYSFVITALVCVILMLFLQYHKRKMKSFDDRICSLSNENDMAKSEIGLYVSKVAGYENDISCNLEKIKSLETSDRAKQREIDSLKDEISALYKSIMSELQKGSTIYETVKSKKTIVHYKDEELNSLIDFFKIIRSDAFSEWLKKYEPLSVRQYLFLILEDLGYDDHDIADVLGVADTTVRSTRFRIKKKVRS
ncbi:MAG: hypothetical protein K2H97_09670 [Prevotella sp.]|nr:hypothetical protein [Prevotella sp.]